MASRLPRSVPSAENVDAVGISAFLDALANTELHSLMVLRHGKVIAEGWWRPYCADEVQLGYSLSKSFTSVALSYALAEHLVRLDDNVADLLGADLNDLDERYARLTVRDLARMTTGHHVDPVQAAWPPAEWPPLDGEPGRTWIYNNWATWTLGRLVQRLAGRSLTDYLEPRLFEPLDIEDWAWLDHDGHQLGFSGLHLATESWAKFGHLLLRRGELWDRQVIDEAYLAEATGPQADNSIEPDGRPRDVGPDWARGYGYQFWRSQHGFRGDGAFGQFVCVLPEQDAVLVITAATDDMQAVLTAAWQHLIPAFGPDARGIDASAATPVDTALAERLARLSLPALANRAPDQAAGFRSGPDNVALASCTQLAASCDDRDWDLTLWLPDGRTTLRAGNGRWITGELPGAFGAPMPVGASAGWRDDNTFEIEVRSLQTPHGIRIVCDEPSGVFSSAWLTEPLAATEFRELALPPDVRHRG